MVTIQTFPFAMEAILTEKSLKDKNFAVIIYEAHTSQTGNTASKLQATLAMSSKKDMATMTVEDILLEISGHGSVHRCLTFRIYRNTEALDHDVVRKSG